MMRGAVKCRLVTRSIGGDAAGRVADRQSDGSAARLREAGVAHVNAAHAIRGRRKQIAGSGCERDVLARAAYRRAGGGEGRYARTAILPANSRISRRAIYGDVYENRQTCRESRRDSDGRNIGKSATRGGILHLDLSDAGVG